MTPPASERFLEACGAAGPLCVEVDGPPGEPAERYVLPRPYALIGRDPAVDVRLDHPDVSRRHAYLQVVGGRVFAVDLDSRTGTISDGRDGPGWLAAGQPFRIGPYRLRAWVGPRPSPSPSSSWCPGPVDEPSPLGSSYAHRHPLPGTAALAIQDGPDASILFPIERAVTLLGGSPRCKIRVRTRGPGASRFYAALVRTPEATWVVDLRSHAGIRLNGRAVEHARLVEGDELQVGRHRMRFVASGKPAPPAAPGVAPDRTDELEAGAPGGVPAVLARAWDIDGPGEGAPLPSQAPPTPEQFQQSLLILSRMIGAMHHDHMEAVREELGLIRQLAEEVKALREAHPPSIPADAPAGAALPAPEEPPRPRLSPEEIDALVSRRLAAYASDPPSTWGRILKLVQPGP